MQLHQISKIFGNDNAQLVKQHLASMPVEFLVEMAVCQYSDSEILNLIKSLTHQAEGLQLEDEPGAAAMKQAPVLNEREKQRMHFYESEASHA